MVCSKTKGIEYTKTAGTEYPDTAGETGAYHGLEKCLIGCLIHEVRKRNKGSPDLNARRPAILQKELWLTRLNARKPAILQKKLRLTRQNARKPAIA